MEVLVTLTDCFFFEQRRRTRSPGTQAFAGLLQSSERHRHLQRFCFLGTGGSASVANQRSLSLVSRHARKVLGSLQRPEHARQNKVAQNRHNFFKVVLSIIITFQLSKPKRIKLLESPPSFL